MKKCLSILALFLICLLSAVGFTACGEGVEFKINFIVDGEIYAIVNTNGNETIKMPKDPTKEDYTFEAWYWDNDIWEQPFTANSLLDAPLSSDMRVYAKFRPNHEHNYTADITVPTCTKQGYTTYTCECGDSYIDDYTNALGHAPVAAVEENRHEPNCTATGSYDSVVYCAVCGAEISRENKTIPATGHDYGEWIETTAPTCTTTGIETRYCSHDNTHKETRTIPALGHDYNTSVTPPTCTEQGYTTYTCSRCGDSYKDNFLDSCHNYVNDVCTVCGLDLSYLNDYNGDYGYNYLATMTKGSEYQALYNAIDKDVKIFHVDADKSADVDGVFTKINYATLGLNEEEAVSVWKTYKDDNPLYYWMSNTVQIAGSYICLNVNSDYTDGAERIAYNDFIYNVIEEYVSKVADNDNAYRKAFAFHDLIIEAIDYAYDESGNPCDEDWAHSVVGVLAQKGAVCESYARTFQLLLNYTGVENLFVTGKGNNESHAWNLVKLDDGNWYWYDLTWDDVVVGDVAGFNKEYIAKFSGIRYNYFAQTDANFLFSHTPNSSNENGVSFLYNLPTRSLASYDDDTLLLNDEFISSGYTCKVIGYNAIEVSYIDSTGAVIIPEYIIFNDVNYYILSLTRIDNNGDQLILSNNITSVILPKSIRYINDNALRSDRLTNIFVDEDNEYFADDNGVLYTKSFYTLIQYPSMHVGSEYVISDKTYEIAAYAFDNCKYLENIYFGANIRGVGFANWGNGYHNEAPTGWFGGNIISGECCRIANTISGEIVIDKTNQSYISDGLAVYTKDGQALMTVFKKTQHLYISATIKALPLEQDFLHSRNGNKNYASGNLVSITVDENNEFFSSSCGVLYNKDMTELLVVPIRITGNIIIPDSVKSIESYTFRGCSELTSVTIGHGVTNIGGYAFANCSRLASVTIPDSVKIIGCFAFYGCSSLTSVIIPNSVTSVGDNAFDGCESLREISLPDSITHIGIRMFSYCSGLTSITIPNSVTDIGALAFYNCSSLTSVYYKGTAEDWANISIDSSNDNLTNATKYYYSETALTEDGNYWHYNTGGITPVIWGKQD